MKELLQNRAWQVALADERKKQEDFSEQASRLGFAYVEQQIQLAYEHLHHPRTRAYTLDQSGQMHLISQNYYH